MEIKYDKIGTDYDLTRKADKHLAENLLRHLNPGANGLYLDIGCGTGNYTNELQKKGFQFIGIDPSNEMLEKARVKNKHIEWRYGTAENAGLPDKSIDGIICSLTIHHWADLKKAFSELFRVIKTNGRIVIFTSTSKQMKGYWLNHYFPKMLNDSIIQMPSLKKIKTLMKTSGFKVVTVELYFIKTDLEDQFLYCGKENPELYFNEKIRNGISSFSSLANRAEVQQGLSDLRKDINSGKIRQIIRSYGNDSGDYLYIIGKKE